MQKFALALAIVALAGLTSPASAQQSRVFAPQTQPNKRPSFDRNAPQDQTTTQRSTKPAQPLPTFALQLNGIEIQAARHRNHCILDANNTFDSSLIKSIQSGIGGGGTFLAATVECAGLTRGRAGDESGALEATLYAAIGDGQPSTLEKHDFARQACDAVTRAPGTQQLSGTAKERMAQLQQRRPSRR